MIYNMAPIDVLWDLLKGVKEQIPIYKNIMNEDKNSIPYSYILLMTANDSPKVYADGVCIIRSANCDIHIISNGPARNSDSTHHLNVKIVEDTIKQNKISYAKHDLGYDLQTGCTQTTISINLNYYG